MTADAFYDPTRGFAGGRPVHAPLRAFKLKNATLSLRGEFNLFGENFSQSLIQRVSSSQNSCKRNTRRALVLAGKPAQKESLCYVEICFCYGELREGEMVCNPSQRTRHTARRLRPHDTPLDVNRVLRQRNKQRSIRSPRRRWRARLELSERADKAALRLITSSNSARAPWFGSRAPELAD
jgi:hypothetical protein